MPSEVMIETKRLRMRTWTPEYGRLLDHHCNNDEVLAHLGGRMTGKQHQDLVDWLIWQQQTYGITFWVLERKRGGDFLGFCGLIIVDEEDSTVLGATEIGWRLRSDAQGKGYAKEAAIACLYHAFEDLNSLRVVSRTVKGNAPSWGLMKSLGMRSDPRLDYLSKDDPEEPLIVYVASYRDWTRVKKQHPDNRVK